jgi:hypothetical protein
LCDPVKATLHPCSEIKQTVYLVPERTDAALPDYSAFAQAVRKNSKKKALHNTAA